MKKLRKISKEYYLRQIVCYWLVFYMFFCFGIPMQVARADPAPGQLPQGWEVVTGSVGGFDYSATNELHIMNIANGTIIKWNQGFNIGSAAWTEFQFAINGSAVMNRDVTGSMSEIYGDLTANGNVFIINPAGIVFGNGSSVNVGALVASSLNLTNDDFHSGLNSGIFNFTGGAAAGPVENHGTINADAIALISKTVLNTGTLNADYVVMAAGDSVKITTDMVSDVVVEVFMPEVDISDYVVDHSDGSITAQHVVLAAGDIWSAAYINASGDGTASVTMTAKGDIDIDGEVYAYAGPGSDAVALVDIDADGDVTITDEVGAEAVGDGVSNATATVTVDAGGNVEVTGDGEVARIYAWAQDGSTNKANVEVTAGGNVDVIGLWGGEAEIEADTENGTNNTGDVKITAKDGRVLVHAVDGVAGINADAWEGVNNTANVTITAKGEDGDVKVIAVKDGEAWIDSEAGCAENSNSADVTINADGDVKVKADEGDAGIGAFAGEDDEYNTANVEITAGGNVEVTATDDGEAQIKAEAEDGQNNTADIQINADGYVKVQADASWSAWAAAKIEAETDDGQNNTANVVIDAKENVQVIANHGEAEIRAEAEDGENNTAIVEVVSDGDVTVKADSTTGVTSTAKIEAEAEDGINNTAEIVIDAVGDVLLMATAGYNANAEITAKAENNFDTDDEIPDEIPGLTNNARVDITAASVEVRGEYDAEAKILARAKNDIDIDSDDVIDATINGSLVNTAVVTIVTTEPVVTATNNNGGTHDGEVLVEGIDGGEAGIGAEARNEIKVGNDSCYDVDITINGSLVNTAKVDITATDQVRVRAFGGDAEAWIYAEAWNEIGNESYQTVGLIVNGNLKNQADTLIDAGDDTTIDSGGIDDGGDDVEVRAEDGGEAGIGTDAWNKLYDLHEYGDTLNVTVNGSVENIANVDITTGDEVWVIADDYSEDDSEAGIYAWSENEIEAYDWDDNVLYKGTVNLTVTGSVTNQADVVINAGDNVEVDADEYAEAYIAAWADNEIYAGTVSVDISGSVDNAAKVDITTGDDVDVYADDDGEAYIEAWAGNYLDDESDNTLNVTVGGSVRNTADVTIDADEDIELYAEYDGEVWIGAWADNEFEGEGVSVSVAGSVQNDATVDIAANENVEVIADDGDAEIVAEAYNGDDNTAKVTVTTGGDVIVDNSYIEAEAEAYNGSDNATASVDIDAGGDVIVGACDGGEAGIKAEAKNGMVSNTAVVDILANNVVVFAEGYSSAEILALAETWLSCPDEMVETKNSANVNIETFTVAVEDTELQGLQQLQSDGIGDVIGDMLEAGGHVAVVAMQGSCEGSRAQITAEAYGATENTAGTAIDAQGSVLVAAVYNAEAEVSAFAENATRSNNASVDIIANNVIAVAVGDSDTRIKARAAHIDYPCDGDGDGYEYEETQNNASVEIRTFAVDIVLPSEEPPSDSPTMMDGPLGDIFGDELQLAETLLEGGHVLVGSLNGGDTQVEAITYGGDCSTTNVSDVLICAEGAVVVGAVGCDDLDTLNGNGQTNAEIKALAHFGYNNNANVGIGAKLGIGVLALGNSEASIASKAFAGYKNTADLVACTKGPAAVLGIYGGNAEIMSEAFDGYTNKASTAVCADSLVAVGAIGDGYAAISSEARNEDGLKLHLDLDGMGDSEPPSATAETIVVSKESGVAVVAIDEAEAGIWSYAGGAYNNDAYTGVCAEDHVIVAAGIDNYFGYGGFLSQDSDNGNGGSGGTAYICSEAGYQHKPWGLGADEERPPGDYEPSTSNAETAVVSHKGSVLVADMTSPEQCGDAAIASEAYGSEINTAYTGVAAGADLAPGGLDVPPVEGAEPDNLLDYLEQAYRDILPPGDVIVYAYGPDSDARIISEAYNGFENTADTVVCAPGEVSVESDGPGSIAKIKSWARNGEINKATTQVYASEVYVDVESLWHGSGIGAWAEGDDWVHVDSEFEWIAGEDEPILWLGESGDSTLIIDSYANKKDCPDCPDCPPCPCVEEVELFAPVAPLAQFQVPTIEGCPQLVQTVAMELGITADTIQVGIGDALALNPTIQPCEACATLINAAGILRDEDGSRMAAMVQTFNALAPADAPFTPEMATSVAMAFEGAAEGTQYASVMEYIDAFVQYAAVLDTGLGSPVGDSVAFVMEKYGAGVTDSDNANIAAFVAIRLETIGE